MYVLCMYNLYCMCSLKNTILANIQIFTIKSTISLLVIIKLDVRGISCIGLGCVRSQIVPADLKSRPSGQHLLDRINALNNKVSHFLQHYQH